MEQTATIRELSILAQRVAKVEENSARIDKLEKAVADINKTAVRILLALCGHAILLIVGMILYANGLLKHV